MNVQEAQARVKARIWQTIAQGKLDVGAVPRDTLEALIEVATNAALIEIDEEIGEELVSSRSSEAVVGNDEQTLWKGRPFLSIATEYIITNERVRIVSGVLGKDRQDVELIRIQDVNQKQSLSERMVNVGDLVIHSHDRSNPDLVLNNIKDPVAVHEILRRAVLDARKKYGLTYREEM